jgi:hypothetical protein
MQDCVSLIDILGLQFFGISSMGGVTTVIGTTGKDEQKVPICINQTESKIVPRNVNSDSL